jgi:hypothetical protein
MSRRCQFEEEKDLCAKVTKVEHDTLFDFLLYLFYGFFGFLDALFASFFDFFHVFEKTPSFNPKIVTVQ